MRPAHNAGLRHRLSLTLVGVALVSVLLLSAVNYTFARFLIDDSVKGLLESIRDGRIQALQNGVDRVESRVSTYAADPSVVAALTDLAAGFEQLDTELTPQQLDGLSQIYDDEFLPPFVAAGVDITGAQLLPSSTAGRYVQQQYIADNPNGFDDRDLLDDAGDGSVYSTAHATYHPMLRELMRNGGFADLFLVDADSGQVVYSVKKRNDLGTDGSTWPEVADFPNIRGIGSALDQLSGVAAGDAALSDAVFYIPSAGAPVVFAAAAVRSGSNVVGAIVTEIPISSLNALMTAGNDWELLGLEKTGEAYVVGGDGTLRSESRVWIDDREAYLRQFVDQYDDQARADLIATVGSPVLLQPVDNAAVSAALGGDEFVGTVTNYLGTQTLAASAPAQISGLNWSVIVEQDTSETSSALNSLLRAILVVLAILLPMIAAIGWLLARTLTRPAEKLVAAAARIADGQLDTNVDDLGRNELGDLGRQLEGVARQLESKEQAILDEEQHIIDMLSAALPDRLVDRVRRGEHAIEDIFDTATAIAITIEGIPGAGGADQDLALEITERLLDEADALMQRFGIERVRRSSGSQLYLAGLDCDDAKTNNAAAFAFAAITTVAEVGAEFGQAFTARVGMSAGNVATGVLGNAQLSFGVWGDPPGTAVTLASLAQPGQVLADASVTEQLGSDWDIGPLEEFPGLADDIAARVVNGPIGAPRAQR